MSPFSALLNQIWLVSPSVLDDPTRLQWADAYAATPDVKADIDNFIAANPEAELVALLASIGEVYVLRPELAQELADGSAQLADTNAGQQLIATLAQQFAANGLDPGLASQAVEVAGEVISGYEAADQSANNIKALFKDIDHILRNVPDPGRSNAAYFDLTNHINDTSTLKLHLPGFGEVWSYFNERHGAGDSYLRRTELQASTGSVWASQLPSGVGNTLIVGDDETLTIGDPGDFHGRLWMEYGSTVDLPGIRATSLSLDADDVLTVHEANGASLALPQGGGLDSSYLFEASPDGHGGTDIGVAGFGIDPVWPTITNLAGTETFTIARGGDTATSALMYVSTTDASTVAGESPNLNDFTPLNHQAVYFAPGATTAAVAVQINPDGVFATSELTFGLVLTSDQNPTWTEPQDIFYIANAGRLAASTSA